MTSAYADHDVLIVSACRTPMGRFCGNLATVSAHELGSVAISGCLKMASDQFAGETPESIAAKISEVVMGQVNTAACGQNPARQAAKAAGIPFTVPAWVVNMVCASGLKAVCQAAQTLRAGHLRGTGVGSGDDVGGGGGGGLIVAGGQESMTRSPHITPAGSCLRRGVSTLPLFGDFRLVDSVLADELTDAFHGVFMGNTAEHVAQKFGIDRRRQDAFALESQMRCKRCVAEGVFEAEIVPVPVSDRNAATTLVTLDETPRPQTTAEALGKLRPAFPEGLSSSQVATVTAGNCCSFADGAAALLLCRADAAANMSVKCPLGRIVGWHQSGCEPMLMGLGPIYAVRALLQKLAWSVDEVDLFEINEAFASQTIAVLDELGLPRERTNVSGGAIALGHPLGCTGARILVTLLHSLHRLAHAHKEGPPAPPGVDGGDGDRPRRGVAALCVGGGMGLAVAVEVLPGALSQQECPLMRRGQ